MLSIIGIKKTIKQHTADMDITDSVDYKISAPPRFYNISTASVIPITHVGLIPLYTIIHINNFFIVGIYLLSTCPKN
jgi:hypothetical protein